MTRPSSYIFHFVLMGVVLILCLAAAIIQDQPKFVDVSDEVGINHHFTVFQGTFGGGAAVIDYDQDGWEDLFLAGGAGEDQLLRNTGNGSFVNVTSATGLDVLDNFVSQGAASADVNKDGWPDLFVTTIAAIDGGNFTEAANALLINNGDGTFSLESDSYGLSQATFSMGASFGDVNKDGYPDLYVANYFEDFRGTLDQYSGPIANGDFRPGRDIFYVNQGGNSFIEASEEYNIFRRGLTFQGLWTDYDNDLDLDLLVANDFGNRGTPNLLYRNEYPEESFTEIGADLKFNFGINGMGLGACDINMDGWLDYMVTNIQVSPFHINQGNGSGFVEESVARGTGFTTVGLDGNSGPRIVPVSWGINFFDMDHDMDQDVYITNGSLNPPLTPNPNLLLVNTDGSFTEMGSITNTNELSNGRGSVTLDYDNDGDLDLLVVNQNPHEMQDIGIEFKGTRFYKNQTESNLNWLKIKLQGEIAESSGIGSKVEVYTDGSLLVREVYGGSSHMSQNSTLVHFGLGENNTVDSLVIKWSSGTIQKLENVNSNQLLTVKEEIDRDKIVEELKTYPNPFSKNISFDIPESLKGQAANANVYNLKGQLVAQQIFNGLQLIGNQVILTNDLNPGMYFLHIVGEDFEQSSKVIKID